MTGETVARLAVAARIGAPFAAVLKNRFGQQADPKGRVISREEARVRSRTILITGASSGLGAALARELAAPGRRLALTARRDDRLEAVAAEVRSRGGEAVAITADLADPAALPTVVQAAVDAFGRIDVLINNAGLGLPRYYAESDADELARQVAVNLTAPILLTRAALPWLYESRGTVINIGSGITAVANPILGAYGATKAGLKYWSEALRRELHHRGVKVCYVALGPVATEFFEAVHRRAARVGDEKPPLGVTPANDGLYNAMRDRPPRLTETTVAEAARRIARLVDRPRPRLALLRRIIWPVQAAGAFFALFPSLGDWSIRYMIRRVEREEAGLGREPAAGANISAGASPTSAISAGASPTSAGRSA